MDAAKRLDQCAIIGGHFRPYSGAVVTCINLLGRRTR